MITLLVAMMTAFISGLAVELLHRRKTRSETELNEVQQAEITAKMALEFAEEKDAFYRIRIGLLEQDNREKNDRISCLEKTVAELQAEILEMRKRLQ